MFTLKISLTVESLSDIQLEIENDDEGEENPLNYMSQNIYHPRVALKSAIRDWLPDFFADKKAFGPMLKPQPPFSAQTPIIPPIIPKINTCMSLTLTTSSSAINASASEVNTTQLQALAEICSTVTASNEHELLKPSVMNSLVSETKVVTTDVIVTPILATSISENNYEKTSPNPAETMEIEKNISTEPSEELMDCGTPKHTLSDNSSLNSEPPAIKEESINGIVTQECKLEKSPMSDDVVMTETSNELETAMQDESISEDEKIDAINYEDILLLCDLFYLPFEHGEIW